MATTVVSTVEDLDGAGHGTVIEQYSDMILYAALGAQRFVQFASERTELMKKSGDTIVFLKFDDLEGDPELASELVGITTDAMSGSAVTISVTEYGKGMAVSEKALQLSFNDIMESQAKLLGRHYAQWGPDLLLRDTALDNGGSDVSVVYGGDAAARTDLVADDVLTTDVIRECVEQLQTSNVPKFNNDFYVCIAHPHQLRYLRQDPDWIAANNYHTTRAPFIGETGRWEDVIFLSTTNLPNGAITTATNISFLDNGGGSNALREGVDGNLTNVYQASIFGDGFLALAWALPVEMRDDGVTDFGRIHKLAWYAIYGAGRLHDDHGLRIETA